MYDRQELLDRLKDVLEALERIPRRSESIHSADDFLVDEAGLEHLDSICTGLHYLQGGYSRTDRDCSYHDKGFAGGRCILIGSVWRLARSPDDLIAT